MKRIAGVLILLGGGAFAADAGGKPITRELGPERYMPPALVEGLAGLVPQIEPTFDWVRLAQRVPVRIKITHVPDGVELIAGTTASVAVRPR